MKILRWLDDPRLDHGVYILNDSWDWELRSYESLCTSIVSLSRRIKEDGLLGRRLGIGADEPISFLIRFFATLHANCTAVPVVPRSAFQTASEYQSRLETLMAGEVIEALFPFDSCVDEPAMINGKQAVSVSAHHGTSGLSEDATVPALIQFSSGTTGTPKPIRITRRAIDANVGMIQQWLDIGAGDATATWLPMYHDMGLIGTGLVPISSQSNLYLMTPQQFLRRPDIWLRCFHQQRCTMTASPPFGYQHAAKRAREERIGDLNLAGWRIAIVGAEPIRPSFMTEFCDRFGPHGFSRRTFCPAYGMAEATLAITAVAVDEDPIDISTPATEMDGPLVSSGRPLEGASVEIRDMAGDPLPEGAVGEIVVRSEAMSDGYGITEDQRHGSSWLNTGDAGSMRSGYLYVYGRISDSFKLRGRTVYVEEAEHLILEAHPTLKSVVLVPSRGSGIGLTALVDIGRTRPLDEDEVSRAIGALFDDLPVDVVSVPARRIPRTTSGKIRRRECWSQFVRPGANASSAEEVLI